jgi:putative effector of murein hydrolase
MTSMLSSPTFAVGLTFCVYYLAQTVYSRRPIFILNPVLISITLIILILKAFSVNYETYYQGGRIISFFLGPVVVALGAPLYRQLEEIRRQGMPILVSTLLGAVVGVSTAAGLAIGLQGLTTAILTPFLIRILF